MGKDLEKAVGLLNTHPEYTCVLVKGEKIISSVKKGIAPLLFLAPKALEENLARLREGN